MTDPHHDTEHKRNMGHKLFYPHCPGAEREPVTNLFGEGKPPPLCDYPEYVRMDLLRSSVNTGQRYDSSPALHIALSSQQYKLPPFKQQMPPLPKIQVFKNNTDSYTGQDHVTSVERFIKSSGLVDNEGKITHFKNYLEDSWKKIVENMESIYLKEHKVHPTWEYIRDYFLTLTADKNIMKRKLQSFINISMTSDESVSQYYSVSYTHLTLPTNREV